MKMHADKNAIVITGGPGMGKTSIIHHLEAMGYSCIPESGRAVIQAELKAGGNNLPWANRKGFAMRMFLRSEADYKKVLQDTQLRFFDRGLPDILGYLNLCKLPIPEKIKRAVTHLRYHQYVFITPPWNEIYTTDTERKQSFPEAKATYREMVSVYTSLGYSLIEIPRLPVRERALFILDSLAV